MLFQPSCQCPARHTAPHVCDDQHRNVASLIQMLNDIKFI